MSGELAILVVALSVAGLLIGVTGTWSPCGFSMVETIGPGGHSGGLPTTLAACATFLPGALIGAVVTFGGLALVGSFVHGAGGTVAWLLAALLALVAALAEARGARIAPQIRRQLPEHWRRVMPMPVAAALYGVLLGLGFTTFVLTFGVWALAGIAFAVGEPVAGLAIGLGFGIGRALPIVVLAPMARTTAGKWALTQMAEHPGLYRGIRLADAMALLATAVVMATGATAIASTGEDGVDGSRTTEVPALDGDESAVADEVAKTEGGGAAELADAPAPNLDQQSAKVPVPVNSFRSAANPAALGDAVAFQKRGGRNSVLVENGQSRQVSGASPSLSDAFVATARGARVTIFERTNLQQVASFQVKGVDAVAISSDWIAYRSRNKGKDRLYARPLDVDGQVGSARVIGRSTKRGQIGRPALDGDRLAYVVSKPRVNRLVVKYLNDGRKLRVVRSSKKLGFAGPSIRGDRVAYVLISGKRSELRLRTLGGGDRRLVKRPKKKALLWSTAIGDGRVYVTELRGKKLRPRIVSVAR